MNKYLSVIIVVLIFVQSVFSQEVKFGKISKEELQEKLYAKDSTADAAVLYRKVDVSFEYIESEGFVIQKSVHERIKIYNKGGFSYGTVKENLYQGSSGSKESISKIKAYTYNLNGNEIEKIKLKGSDTFKEEASRYYMREKFTMPNLKEGSVIEYQYVISSPFYSSFNEVVLQYDIPIKQQQVRVEIPEYFIFKNTIKGYLDYNIQKSTKPISLIINGKQKTLSEGGSIKIGARNSTSFSTSKFDYIANVSSVKMNDVPALKEEIYVNSMENYRSAIKYEIQYTKLPNNASKNYSTSWEKVVKNIYDNEDFGSQLKKNKFYKEDLQQVLIGKASEKDKLSAVFGYVQSRMNWNGLYGYYTDEGVKKAYDLKTGNVADINLMLVSMLRSAGLKANPVLVSTRSNGVPFFPTRNGFNYVVASVDLGGVDVLLDATSDYSKSNMLPVRAVNWLGRIVKEGGASAFVSLMPDYKSLENVIMVASVDSDGNVEGKIRRACKDYIAYNFRTQNLDLDEEAYLEKLEENYNGIEITDYTVKNKNIVGKQILESLSYTMENSAEIIGDKMYVSPLFWFSQMENPFKLEERKYPVDFGYPWEDKHTVLLHIPEGYKVESIPAPINLKLENDVGQFIYQIIKSPDGSLQISSDLKMNKAIISPQYYLGLKDFYKAVVEKQTEKVVLTKI